MMIWLIGCKGMLGTELSLLFAENGVSFIGTDREVDITSEAALLAYAEAQATAGRPVDWIVNCAAYTAVDKAEDDVDLCRALNTVGAGNIARCAKAIHAGLIHLSTDYVFDGTGIPAASGIVAPGGAPNTPPRPYREDDETGPIGIYGLTKRDGERVILAAGPRFYIIRTAWLYGEHGGNFVHTMLRLMNERDSVSVVNDQRGSSTWSRDLSEVILALLGAARQSRDTPSSGIYHFTNEGEITWFDFAREIYARGREFGLITSDCELKPCTSTEYPARVTRPAYSVLDKTKIRGALRLNIPAWDKSLAVFLSQKAAPR
jgi:dTDP-4-dehydrorhamnose reductase